eukprot:scaffold7377_cov257-Pinguiococcus_pyrenoidosus.AAC.1
MDKESFRCRWIPLGSWSADSLAISAVVFSSAIDAIVVLLCKKRWRTLSRSRRRSPESRPRLSPARPLHLRHLRRTAALLRRRCQDLERHTSRRTHATGDWRGHPALANRSRRRLLHPAPLDASRRRPGPLGAARCPRMPCAPPRRVRYSTNGRRCRTFRAAPGRARASQRRWSRRPAAPRPASLHGAPLGSLVQPPLPHAVLRRLADQCTLANRVVVDPHGAASGTVGMLQVKQHEILGSRRQATKDQRLLAVGSFPFDLHPVWRLELLEDVHAEALVPASSAHGSRRQDLQLSQVLTRNGQGMKRAALVASDEDLRMVLREPLQCNA